MKKNAIFVLSGNCRTFIDCIDSIYLNIISELFDDTYEIYLYLYLKLSDPGPKNQEGWNFSYDKINKDKLIEKINNYSFLKIIYKINENNEISDNDLLQQVKNRNLFNSNNDFGYSIDSCFLRGLHCHYNFEKCGNNILEIENENNIKFNYIIYIRPDLFFTKKCDKIETYNNELVTFGTGPNIENMDHIAIIPRNFLNKFFFGRMEIYRNNNDVIFTNPEDVYKYNINYEIKDIGNYFIKRY